MLIGNTRIRTVRELASTDRHDRLVEDIGPDSWEHHLEQTEWEHRIAELASRLLQHEDDFDKELPWLNSDKARSSVQFGDQLGRLDENLSLLDRIVAACRATRNPNLSRGYFAGVSQNMGPKLSPYALLFLFVLIAVFAAIEHKQNRNQQVLEDRAFEIEVEFRRIQMEASGSEEKLIISPRIAHAVLDSSIQSGAIRRFVENSNRWFYWVLVAVIFAAFAGR